MNIIRLSSIILILTLASSCAIRKDLQTPFLDPTNTPGVDDGKNGDGTKYCQPDSEGKFDGVATSVVKGTKKWAWAEGGGCVLRPIREAWAVLNNLEAMKFKDVDTITFQKTVNPKANIALLYEITYHKNTIIGDINWTIQWYHGFDQGTFAAPERVNINYQRVRGTSNIPVWQGGIVLTKINDKVTSIAIRNEFKARQSQGDNENSARDALLEMINDVREAKPDYDQLDSKKSQ